MVRYKILVGLFSAIFILIILLCTNTTWASMPPIRTVDVTIEVLDYNTGVEITPYQLIYNKHGISEEYFIYESPEILLLPYAEENATLTVIREGYNTSSKILIFNEDKHVIFNLNPIPLTSVDINVKDVDNTSVNNAIVAVKTINGGESFSGQTNENGVFSFSAQFVNYEITVTKEGYYDGYETIVVDHNLSEMGFNITLYEIPPIYQRLVYLTIKDAEEKTIEGATVNIRTRYSDQVNLTSITDENGFVVFELASDDYDIIVSTEEHGSEKFGLWIGNKPTAWEGHLQIGTGMGEPVEPQQSIEKSFIEENKNLLIIIGVVAVVCIAGFIMLFKRSRKPKEPKSD